MVDTKREPAVRRPPANLHALLADTQMFMQELAGDIAAGLRTPAEWADIMSRTLEDAHARAAVAGRHYAGDLAPMEEDDRRFAALVMDAESEFLDAFRADIEAGRYTTDGVTDAEAIGARAQLYAARLVGTANETFVLASPEDSLWTWVLGATERHCARCPEIAAGGPYTRWTLPTVPGAGDTPCIFACDCGLVRSDGVQGFVHE